MSPLTEKSTILIVDDSEPIRVLLRSYLREEGYLVLEAENGVTGLDSCLTESPDLILLDIAMPEMDGFSMFKSLQKVKSLRSIPVIMISADTDYETKMQAFTLGAVDYITKPFNHGEVMARIRTHLTINQLTQSLQQANQTLILQKKELMQGIQAAADLQRNLLPKQVPNCRKLKFSSYFNPCEEIGGDIYNILRLDDEHIAVYLLDVSGHGFPAAMMTALVTQALTTSGGITTKDNGEKKTISPPASVLRELDREFPIDRFNLYMTIVYLVFNTRTSTFSYSCAGHPPPVHLTDRGINFLNAGGPPAGMGDSKSTWKNGEGRLEKGDRIFFYTDGITEQEDSNGQAYSQDRFLKTVVSSRTLPLQGAVQNITGELKQFSRSPEFDDDVTILAVERIECGEE